MISFYQDERWPAFAERYAFDLTAFAREVCGHVITPGLAAAFAHVEQPSCRLLLDDIQPASTQGLLLATMALWHLTTRPESMTVITSPRGVHWASDTALPLILSNLFGGPYAWLAAGLKRGLNFWCVKGSPLSRISLRKINRKAPEELAGLCNRYLLWLVEGADDLPREHYAVIGGSCMYQANGIVIAANGTPAAYLLDIAARTLRNDELESQRSQEVRP
jgi:hypothetical protein